MKQQMFGPMKPLTGDEYDTIFSTTGIDIDGRRELLQSCFIPHIEACVKRFVVFVKAIPGFTRLPLADQIALVKGIGTLKHTCTHAHHTHRLSGTTQVSRYQKGKISLDLLKQETVSGRGISWAICKSAPRSRQITMPAPHLWYFEALN